MLSEWLASPPHENNATHFEQEMRNLAWQHAFPGITKDREFLSIEWHRLHSLDEIDAISVWAKRIRNKDILRLVQFAGDLADQASAQFAEIEVWLTASDQALIFKLIPIITKKVLSCGGIFGQHSLEYQSLEEGEGIPGYWYSKGVHIFES